MTLLNGSAFIYATSSVEALDSFSKAKGMAHQVPKSFFKVNGRELTAQNRTYKADINIIDFDNLTLHEPEVLYDLPAGGRRLVQKASGYEYTIVSGQVAFKDGEATGALNGRLIRNQVS